MEENKTGKAVSSGAKKVETVEKEKAAEAANASAPKRVKSTGSKTGATKSKRPTQKKVSPAEKMEEAAAEKRIARAKVKAEKKEKKLIGRAELKQKRLEKRAEIKERKLARRAEIARKRAERKQKRVEHAAALKEKRVERRAERIARRELLRNESKSERAARREREKKERIALRSRRQAARAKAREERIKSRRASKERASKERMHKREQKTERRKHAPGFGGWLAAVISLGVACLALSTIVTAGAFRLNDINLQTANAYRSTLYELAATSESMEGDLAKLRVSSGAGEQQTLLTELLVDSELMESALERMPVDGATSAELSSFVNRTGEYCRTLLRKVSKGQPVTQSEMDALEYLYEVNTELFGSLNDMTNHMNEKDFKAFIAGKGGALSERFGEMGKSAAREPEDLTDAPFSQEGNVGENMLTGEEVSEQKAEELVREYLRAYHIAEAQYTGETAAEGRSAYNFTLKDESGNDIFAQITKNGGKLAFFDTYEECSEKNFDLETCDGLARDFLEGLGYTGVEAVWLSDGGMVADLTYVTVQNGVRVYPELIRVRVCESRGRVVGMDAMTYLVNHGAERTVGQTLSREEAQSKLSSHLTPYSAHLAIIPINGEEVAAHEFACTYGEEEYVVYLDAATGEELLVYRVQNSAQGSFLK